MQGNRDISYSRPSESTSTKCSEDPKRLTLYGLVMGFLPAFRHLETGEVRLCQTRDGGLSPIHLLDGLPDHWIMERDTKGRACALVDAVEPGFLRGIAFWTLGDLEYPALDG